MYLVCCLQKVTNYCGPEKEDCVGNQTLKDESCLVPCTGLYADIADHIQTQRNQQNMMKGIGFANIYKSFPTTLQVCKN